MAMAIIRDAVVATDVKWAGEDCKQVDVIGHKQVAAKYYVSVLVKGKGYKQGVIDIMQAVTDLDSSLKLKELDHC